MFLWSFSNHFTYNFLYFIKILIILLGTNTYFHEIKEYQERLDSEHIMDRRIIKKELKTEDNYIDKLLDPDP